MYKAYAERHVTKPENRSPDFRLSEKPAAAVGTDGDEKRWMKKIR